MPLEGNQFTLGVYHGWNGSKGPESSLRSTKGETGETIPTPYVQFHICQPCAERFLSPLMLAIKASVEAGNAVPLFEAAAKMTEQGMMVANLPQVRSVLHYVAKWLDDVYYSLSSGPRAKEPDQMSQAGTVKAMRNHLNVAISGDFGPMKSAYRDADNVRCSACHEVLGLVDLTGAWRWTGEAWEHKCEDSHAQAGHFSAELIPAGSLPLFDPWGRKYACDSAGERLQKLRTWAAQAGAILPPVPIISDQTDNSPLGVRFAELSAGDQKEIILRHGSKEYARSRRPVEECVWLWSEGKWIGYDPTRNAEDSQLYPPPADPADTPAEMDTMNFTGEPSGGLDNPGGLNRFRKAGE